MAFARQGAKDRQLREDALRAQVRLADTAEQRLAAERDREATDRERAELQDDRDRHIIEYLKSTKSASATTKNCNQQEYIELPAVRPSQGGRKPDPISQLAIQFIEKDGMDDEKAITEALRRDHGKTSSRRKIIEAIRYHRAKKDAENSKP
jgi:hypothetical protein